MVNYKKQITQTAITGLLKNEGISLPPLSFRLIESKPTINGVRHLDALISGCWDGPKLLFAAKIKPLSTPRAFMEGVALLETKPLPESYQPLLIMPFLGEKQLRELEQEKISGVDLCGNGVIVISGKLTIFRTGQPNRFPSWAPIKNIYRRNSSMVGRMFLARPQFTSVKQLVEAVRTGDILASATGQSPLTFSTVSKVLAGMEQEVIIERGEGLIGLLQADTLLEKLSLNYTGPVGADTIAVKAGLDEKNLLDRLSALSAELKTPVVATGFSSVFRYAVMQREEKLSVYCPRARELLSLLPSTPSRFPNLEITDTSDATLYFDARRENDFYWASPVQTYLELMSGDKRDRETAGQIREYLPNSIKRDPHE